MLHRLHQVTGLLVVVVLCSAPPRHPPRQTRTTYGVDFDGRLWAFNELSCAGAMICVNNRSFGVSRGLTAPVEALVAARSLGSRASPGRHDPACPVRQIVRVRPIGIRFPDAVPAILTELGQAEIKVSRRMAPMKGI